MTRTDAKALLLEVLIEERDELQKELDKLNTKISLLQTRI